MTPEDQFDRLIAQRQAGRLPAPPAPEDAARLAAADVVRDLRQIPIPATMARQLEVRLRQQARVLQRQDDDTATYVIPVARAAQRRATRPLIISLASVAALCAIVVGLFAASAGSLPGDPLYGIKQFTNQIALSQASSPKSHAHIAIQQLLSAVHDLQAEVSGGRSDDDIVQAVAVVAQATRAAQTYVTALPSGADQTQAQADLGAALTQEHSLLRQILPNAHWPVRLAVSGQLGALGDPVPTITQIAINNSGDGASGGDGQNGGQMTVTITGTNFATGAQVFLDEAPVTAITSVTATQIVLTLDHSALDGHTHTLAVENPDGTAAESPVQGSDNTGSHGEHGTPTPSPSGTPDDGKSHSHGSPTPGPSNGHGP